MASLAFVEDLLADEVLPGKETVILTPYQAQWMRYLDYLARAEAPVVIVDLVVTTKAGFVEQANRLNVSLSRAKYGMHIVASMNILEERGVGKWITRVFGYLRKFQCYDNFRKMEFEEVSPESDSAWHPHPTFATDSENPGSASPDRDWQPDPSSPDSAWNPDLSIEMTAGSAKCEWSISIFDTVLPLRSTLRIPILPLLTAPHVPIAPLRLMVCFWCHRCDFFEGPNSASGILFQPSYLMDWSTCEVARRKLYDSVA